MKKINLLVAIFIIAISLSNIFADDHIFTLPVSGNDLKVSAGWYYPDGTSHSAVDYISSSGTGTINGRDILAAYGGVVIQVVNSVPDGTGTGYGNYVKIDHQNGYISLYGHMLCNSSTVNIGDIIIQGQIIGRVGNTGNSTGYHLHFQIWKNNQPVDPYGWYEAPNTNGSPYTNCNPSEYYFTENPPIHAPNPTSNQRIVPDDVICHVIGTPSYRWIRNGVMCNFSNEYVFYTWGFNWDEAIEVTQNEVSQFQEGPPVEVKVGTCVFDQSYQRWVFDYASDSSPTIVKRRATNWQSLGYQSDVWIPVSTSFMSSFNEGPELLSGYPYGAVLKNGSNRYVLVKGEQFGSSFAGQKVKLPIFSNDAYNINYYHYNFNINVSQSVLDSYPTVPSNFSEHIMDGKLIRSTTGDQIYYLENGYKRHITDGTTFSYYGFSYAFVHQVSDNDVNSFPEGDQIYFSPSGGVTDFDGLELDDGGFDSGLLSYWRFNDWQEVVNFQITNSNSIAGAFKSEVQINSSVNYYDVELKQLVAVENGFYYHLSFWVKANGNIPFKLALQKDTSPWNNYGLWKEITASNTWVKHQYIFTCTSLDPIARLTFMLGENVGHFYFDQVVFEKIANIIPPNGDLIANGNFELGHFAPWFMEDNNNVASYYTDEVNYHSGFNSMFVDPNQNGQFFEVQLRQCINIQSGQTYRVSFWAKAQSERSLKLDLYNDGAPWNNYGLWAEMQIGTEWQRYSTQFTATSSGNPRFGIHLGHQDIPIWLDDISISQLGTSINDEQVSPIKDFVLYQNYPNPFKVSTNISYSAKKSGAKLFIYNIKGELVDSFEINKNKQEIVWNAKDKNQKQLSSGVYLYTICYNEIKLSLRKMVYIK